MWFWIIFSYVFIGGVLFTVTQAFSNRYQQWYTVKFEKQAILACILFWPIILFMGLIRLLWEALIGLRRIIKMIFY